MKKLTPETCFNFTNTARLKLLRKEEQVKNKMSIES